MSQYINIYFTYTLCDMKPFCINLDEKTLARVKKYSEEHGIAKAVVIRLAVNDFFLNLKAKV